MRRSFDVVVCGGGSAGLSAAAEVARGGLGVSVALVDPVGGGGRVATLVSEVEWPGVTAMDLCQPLAGPEVAAELMEEALRAGIELVFDEVTAVQTTSELQVVGYTDTYAARVVILATGSSVRPLGVPGEKELRGRGVLECASCDGPLYASKELLVVGGGDSATEEALFLASIASKVWLAFLEDNLHCDERRAARVTATPNIELSPRTRIAEVSEGEGCLRVSAMSGGQATVWNVAAVFPYAGLAPMTSYLGPEFDLDCDRYVTVSAALMTTVPGVFAAGDIRRGSTLSVAGAVADGVIAGKKALEYLRR